MGYKKFLLIDMDTVEIGNVGRQIFYTPRDIGQYKVDVARKRVIDRDNTIHCECHSGTFESAKQYVLESDIIIGCVDNLETREEINLFAIEYNKPYIDGGSTGFGGQVQLIIPHVFNFSNYLLENPLFSLLIKSL